MDVAVFVVCAVIVLTGAFGVILSRNPVHAALMLVMTLFGIAVLFIAQDAQFLAAVQVIVYAGAIVVLFLFVIMLLGVDRSENLLSEPIKLQRPVALLAVGAVLALLVVAIFSGSTSATGAESVGGANAGGAGNTADLARSLFTDYVFAFEVTSVLLVIAVIGAVVLARRPERPRDGDEVEEASPSS